MSSDEFSVAVSAEGNTLIYNFTFSEAIDLSDESLRASVVSAFESGMEQQRSVFEGLADQIRAQVQGDDVAIRVVYNNADALRFTPQPLHKFCPKAYCFSPFAML